MKLENQVCSLELAKKLKELGVKQDGFFSWDMAGGICLSKAGIDDRFYSAFTASELGEMLPKWYASWRDVDDYEEDGVKYGHTYVCGREDKIKSGEEEFMVGLTEADARAKMLIYLIESNFINQ